MSTNAGLSEIRAVCEDDVVTFDPSEAPSVEFCYIDISAVDNRAKTIVSPQRLLGSKAPSRARQKVETGDVLVATTRPNLNAVALVPAERSGNVASTGFCVLRPRRDLILPEYLFQWVQHPNFVSALTDLVQGALYPAVSDRQVKAQEIPLPPLDRQREIVARLDTQLAAAARARAAVAARLADAERMQSAALADVFGPMEKQPQAQLGDVISAPLRTGTSKAGAADSSFRCLTLSAVRDGRLDFSASKITGLSVADARRSQVRAGAFYVVRGNGNRRLVGRGALAPEDTPTPMAFPDLLFEVQPDATKLRADYLRWVWDSPAVRRQIEDASATAAGIYKINQKNLARIEFPLPPVSAQQEIAAKLARQMEALSALTRALTAQLADLDRLPGALLREAFAS